MSYSGYNTRFYFRFESQAGREFRIDIKKLGYTGSAQQRPFGQTPVLKRESGDNGVHGTSLEIYAVCKTDGEYAELYTSSAREYLVVLSEVSGGTTTALWHGFITPELYAEPEVAPPYDVQIVATDGLGELKLYDFEAAGRVSLYTHLYNLLSTTGLDCAQSDIVVVNSLACNTPSVNATNLLTGIYVDLDHLVGEGTQYDALVGILASLHMSITRYADKWLLYRESDIVVSSGSIAAKNAAGTSVSLPVAQYGSMKTHSWYPVGRMETDIEPAKNEIAVAFPFQAKESMFVNPNLPNGTGWTYPDYESSHSHYVQWYSIAGGDRRPCLKNDTLGSCSIYQDINVDAYDGRLTLRFLTAAAYDEDFAIKTRNYSVYFRLRLTTSGATYYLKKSNQSCEWVTSDTEIEYEAPKLSGYTAGISIPVSAYTETSFGIPGLPASGTLRIEITSKEKLFQMVQEFFLGGVFLTQDSVPGYKDVIVLNNDARGSGNEAVLEFGDSQFVPNALKNFLNVTSNSSGVACSEWEDARYSGELLSVISMDYALGVALPRLNAKGTLNIPSSAQVPMAFVNPDGITMLVRESSWKILSDDLEVQLISVPAASLTIISETITELTEEEAVSAGGSGGSSHSGGSGGGGGGSSSSKYFEDVLDDTTGELVGAKALYDLHIIQTPADEEQNTPEVTKNITEILRHFRLATSNNVSYLVSDISLGSDANVFAGGIADPGGDTPSGSLADLVDTDIDDTTALADGQTLIYNAASGKWRNAANSLASLSDTAISSPNNGQALVYNSSTGKWEPGTISTSVTVVNNAADVGTSLTTIATINGTAITAKITHQSLSGYATETWVTNKGYATETWVTNKGYITSSALSGYATQTWVGQQGYLTSVPAATDSAYGGFKTGYSESGKNYAVKLSSGKAYVNVPWTDTVYTHPTGGANTTITAANGRVLSAITVDAYGHTTSVSSKTLIAADIPDLSGSYLPISGGTLTGDLRLQNGNYGRTLYFGDSAFAYLSEVSDDVLKMYGDKGLKFLTGGSSYGLEIGSSTVATPATIYGDLTVGTTSTNKTVTICGSTSAALTIKGGSSYTTNIYRTSSALYISNAISVGGNIDASGNITATGQVTAGSASDRRLKSSIEDISINVAADILARLHPVSFCWNDDAKRLSSGQLSGESRGFIADEYLDVIHNSGRKIWGEYDAIDYDQTIPYLVGGWQQHNMRIRILESEIAALKIDNEILRRRLQDVKK